MNIQEVIEKLNKSSKKGEFHKVEISSSGINYDCYLCNDCNDCNYCYNQKGEQYMIFNIEVGKEFYELAMKGREG